MATSAATNATSPGNSPTKPLPCASRSPASPSPRSRPRDSALQGPDVLVRAFIASLLNVAMRQRPNQQIELMSAAKKEASLSTSTAPTQVRSVVKSLHLADRGNKPIERGNQSSKWLQ